MLTLSLLRHAKSDRDDAGSKDIERPLSERGRRAAPAMGAYMRAEGLVPGLVLSSTSVRTRETCQLVLGNFTPSPTVAFEDVLYLASPKTLLGRIRRTPAGIGHLMVIGHNPGLQALALELIATAPRTKLAALAAKLPTAGLVVLELEARDWAAVMPVTARLARFVTPAMLEV